jgi:hypothetical protein
MNNIKFRSGVAGLCAAAAFAVLLCVSLPTIAHAEQVFPVLQIGTQTYSNVTVTTKTTNYVFLVHSSGMLNVRVADLSPEVKEQLGYEIPKPKISKEKAVEMVKQAIEKVQTPMVKSVTAQSEELWRTRVANSIPPIEQIPPKVLVGVIVGVLLVHFFYCYCCQLICLKALYEPGPLIWLPLFNFIPLLRAARMSGWWFVLCCLPVVNFLPYLVWSFKIVKARGLNFLVTILLLLPVFQILGFFLLAFLSPPETNADRAAGAMRLENA